MLKNLKNKLGYALHELLLETRLVSSIGNQVFNNQVNQTQLLLQYQQILKLGLSTPQFQDTGFRVYSQNDEDGLLLYIFSLIGTTNKICVDLAFGSPYGSNTTNLLVNWGWNGLLIEGNQKLINISNDFFGNHPDTWIYPPQLLQSWVTTENINVLLKQNGVQGEIDLFSLDIDGVDYWLWNSLEIVQPRVVIVEFQDMWGEERAVTVPYRSDFNRFDTHPDYFGASLPAFVKLARQKGYRLVGCNRFGFNAFFVASGIAEDLLPEVPINACLKHPKVKYSQMYRLPNVSSYEWVEI